MSQIAAERLSAIMLLVYGDESLDATQSRVCAVAGLIGTDEMWRSIEPKWIERNAGIPFHAADCESNHGDYEGKPDYENKTLYKELAIMLAESGIGGFAAVIDLAAQRKTYKPEFEPPLYYQGFNEVVMAMRNAADDRGDIAKLTFDNRIESNFNAGEIYSFLRESGLHWNERLAEEVSFVCSRKNPRVQMADLFAREAMKDMDNQIGPVNRLPRKSWECLNATGRFKLRKFDEKYFSDPRMSPDAIHEILGFNKTAFSEWLSRNRFPNCHTSFFRFLFEQRRQMTQEQLAKFDELYGEESTLWPNLN